MTFIILFCTALSITTLLYSLSVTLSAQKIDKDLGWSCYWLLAVNAVAFGALFNRIMHGLLPFQNTSSTIIAIIYYVVELFAAASAYRYFRKKEK